MAIIDYKSFKHLFENNDHDNVLRIIDEEGIQILPDSHFYYIIFSDMIRPENHGIINQINLLYEIRILSDEILDDDLQNYIKQRLAVTLNPFLIFWYTRRKFENKSDYTLIPIMKDAIVHMVSAYIALRDLKILYSIIDHVLYCIATSVSFKNKDAINISITQMNLAISHAITIQDFSANRKIYGFFGDFSNLKPILNLQLLKDLLFAEIGAFPNNAPLIFSSANHAFKELESLFEMAGDKDNYIKLLQDKIEKCRVNLEIKDLLASHKMFICDELMVLYQKIGDEQNAAKYGTEKRMFARLMTKYEMVPILYDLEIKGDDIDKFIEKILPLTPFEQLMYINMNLQVPKIENEEKSILDYAHKFLIEPDGRKINSYKGDKQYLLIEYIIGFFQLTLKKLFTEEKIIDALYEFISRIYPHRKEYLLHAIIRAQAGDYISAIHILTFQLEGILREILDLKELQSYRKDQNDDDMNVAFGYIIHKIKEKVLLDAEFADFIEYWMGKGGRNLRNTIAHGDRSLNLGMMDYFFLLYCLVEIPKITLEKTADNKDALKIKIFRLTREEEQK